MDTEAAVVPDTSKRGKWLTLPFIFGTNGCLALACGGLQANLIVYLIEQFNVKSIDAAQISNKVNAGLSFFPVIGAILDDSFLGSFAVIAMSCGLAFLGTLLLTLTSVIDSLRPKPCQPGSSICHSPSKFQYALLYVALTVCCIGFGVSKFPLSTMGANQFNEPKDQDRFFNWFFFTMYLSYAVSFTGLVYIQDNVSWRVGYGICLGASFVGLLTFLSGYNFYRRDKPRHNPFTSLARVVVASIRKMKMSNKVQYLYYQTPDATSDKQEVPPRLTDTLRVFNKAAIETEGDTNRDGSIAKPWRLCTVQQVEDFKKLLKILPIWSTGIMVSVPIAVQGGLTVLQALAMDRRIGHFKIPAGSILVLSFISTFVALIFVDRYFPLLWKKVLRRSPTPLQRIGIGHVLVAFGMCVSALVEKRRLEMSRDKVEMLAIWVFPQLILVGIAEAFTVGQAMFYYQEFPVSLRSTATAMFSLILGVAFYLSTSFVDIVQALTDWLPNDIDHGRVDNVYWVLVVLGAINFVYFLCCAKYFKYRQDVDTLVLVGTSTDSAK